MTPYVIVTGDFTNFGGMDRANYELAWHLADRVGAPVHLIAYRVLPPLVEHPNVVWHRVPKPLNSYTLAEPLFEGIAALLGRLKGNGWLLGVATGKSDRGLQSCLVNHGIFDLFVTLQTADRHPSKPDPSMLAAAMREAGAEPADTVMIGDTAYDIAMARAAGCRALGVAWGYHEPRELLAAGAEAVAQTPPELEDLLDG